MLHIIDFLGQLRDNNNRAWFQEHKAEYQQCKVEFDAFVQRLIEGIRQFDDSIGQLSVADCTYRIYRDTRFSSDKSPYKTHMGAFIAPGGKKSGFSGYYFQVGPSEGGYDDGCMLAAGNYYCEPAVLKLLREDIALDQGAEFKATLDAAPSFQLDWSNALKRVPAGHDPEAQYSQWLRLRNYCLFKDTGRDYMVADNLLKRLVDDFRTSMPFIKFVNRAISYTREEI